MFLCVCVCVYVVSAHVCQCGRWRVISMVFHVLACTWFFTPTFLSAGLSGLAKELFTEFADSLPGINETKIFFQIMVYVCDHNSDSVNNAKTAFCMECIHQKNCTYMYMHAYCKRLMVLHDIHTYVRYALSWKSFCTLIPLVRVAILDTS